MTRTKKSPIYLRFVGFRTISIVFQVILPFPRSHQPKNWRFRFDLSKITRPVAATVLVFLPASLWLATLECAINPGSNTSELLVPGRYIGGSSAGLAKAQHIDSSLRADCLSCFWPGVNGGLPGRGVWCYWGREDGRDVTNQLACYPMASGSDPLAKCWLLVTLSVLSTQVRIPMGCQEVTLPNRTDLPCFNIQGSFW